MVLIELLDKSIFILKNYDFAQQNLNDESQAYTQKSDQKYTWELFCDPLQKFNFPFFHFNKSNLKEDKIPRQKELISSTVLYLKI